MLSRALARPCAALSCGCCSWRLLCCKDARIIAPNRGFCVVLSCANICTGCTCRRDTLTGIANMSYPIGVAGERATQLANTDMHAPTAAAELYFNTNEMALFLEGLRERAAMNEAEMDEMQARIDFQDDLQRRRTHADACARLHQPPPQQRYHHRPVDRRYSYQSYCQAPRNTYQSHGHASFDPYTYGYGSVEYNYDGGEFVEACSGDIIVNNHYYASCGCDEPEYGGDPMGGEDAESEEYALEEPVYDAWYDEAGMHEGDEYALEEPVYDAGYDEGAEHEPERDWAGLDWTGLD